MYISLNNTKQLFIYYKIYFWEERRTYPIVFVVSGEVLARRRIRTAWLSNKNLSGCCQNYNGMVEQRTATYSVRRYKIQPNFDFKIFN